MSITQKTAPFFLRRPVFYTDAPAAAGDLAACPDHVGKASAAHQRDYLTHLHATLKAPCHLIRNWRLRLTSDSPDLLAIIKQEGNILMLSLTKNFVFFA